MFLNSSFVSLCIKLFSFPIKNSFVEKLRAAIARLKWWKEGSAAARRRFECSLLTLLPPQAKTDNNKLGWLIGGSNSAHYYFSFFLLLWSCVQIQQHTYTTNPKRICLYFVRRPMYDLLRLTSQLSLSSLCVVLIWKTRKLHSILLTNSLTNQRLLD